MPFELDYKTNIQVIPPYTSKIKYALSPAVERQSEFYYNVALGHYKDSTFLDEAINRYKKFLYLKRVHPQLFVVPMYDIDLIWHTHQLFPEIYRRDMMANLQQVLHHDDTTQDRSANAKLSTSDQETRQKWFELYGDRLPKNGCMYRGKTSKGLYQNLTDFKFLLECQRYAMYVQFIEHETPSATKTDFDKEVSTVVALNDHSVGGNLPEQVFAQFNTSEQELFIRGSSGHIEAHFDADFVDFTSALTLKIQQKSGFWPMNYYSSVVEFPLPTERVQPITNWTQPVHAANHTTGEDNPSALYHLFEKTLDEHSNLRALVPHAKKLVVGVPAMDINTVIVRLEAVHYDLIKLDTNYLAQLGPSFLFNLENVQVHQAMHKIIPSHQEDPVLLNIRHTLLNDTHIFTATFNKAIFASCHSLDWSQLPLSEQVSSYHDVSAITLNPEREEALIIKDHNGDWGIVKFSQELFTHSLDDPSNDKNYQFSLFRFMPDGRVEQEIIYVDWEDEKWMIGSKNFAIDMNTWAISVKRIELTNVIQYICLGAALITRFDVLFKQMFGKTEEDIVVAQNEKSLNQNSLANDYGKMNLNGLKSDLTMNNV